MEHAKRKHALFNASSADFWMECNLWVHHKVQAEAEGREYDKAGEAARRGTLCHEVAELVLDHVLEDGEGGTVEQYIDMLAPIHKLTKEESNNVETAVQAALDVIHARGGAMLVELEAAVQLSHEPESDGHVDVLAYGQDAIVVADYKFGEGAVSPNSHQLRIYGANAIRSVEQGQGKPLDPDTEVFLAVVQPKLHSEALVRRFRADELVAYRHHVEHVVENQRSRNDRRGASSLSTCEWCPFKQDCGHHRDLKKSMFTKMRKEVKDDAEIEEIVRARGALKKIIDEAVEIVVSEEERFPNWTRAKVANARKWSPLVGDEGIGKQLLDAGAVEVYGLRSPAQIRDKNKKLVKLVETLSLDQGHHVRLYEGAPKSGPVVEPPKRPATEPVKKKRTNKQ